VVTLDLVYVADPKPEYVVVKKTPDGLGLKLMDNGNGRILIMKKTKKCQIQKIKNGSAIVEIDRFCILGILYRK